jgi:hypothetical protein
MEMNPDKLSKITMYKSEQDYNLHCTLDTQRKEKAPVSNPCQTATQLAASLG